MIARVWSAQTTSAQAPAYADLLRNQVLPTIHKIDGYTGAMLLERTLPDMVEIILITFWQSIDAIREFAGTDLEKAVIPKEIAAVLTQFDQRVRHYEVAVKDDR